MEWYVIKSMSGQELPVVNKIQMCMACEDVSFKARAFVPRVKRKRKYMGAWHTEERVLFSGYVFVEIEKEDLLAFRDFLRRYGQTVRFVNTDGEMLPITEAERQYIKHLIGEDEVAQVSVGYIEGDKVYVTDGPLVGREGDVVKINRHKREAVVAIPFMGDVVRVTLSLEIVSKTGKSDAEADEPDKDI